jgi:hypothetical protein
MGQSCSEDCHENEFRKNLDCNCDMRVRDADLVRLVSPAGRFAVG